jgi:hypothetical protein
MRLRLVTQTLLVAILLHALAALVLGDLRFSSFLQRAHRGFGQDAGYPERNASTGWRRPQQTSFVNGPIRPRLLAGLRRVPPA